MTGAHPAGRWEQVLLAAREALQALQQEPLRIDACCAERKCAHFCNGATPRTNSASSQPNAALTASIERLASLVMKFVEQSSMPPCGCAVETNTKNAASHQESAPSCLIDRLPGGLRAKLVELGHSSKSPVDKQLKIQRIVSAHIDTIKEFIEGGVSISDLVLLLHEVGVTSKHGAPLPLTTVASAIARATAKAPGEKPTGGHPPKQFAAHQTAGAPTPLPMPQTTSIENSAPTPSSAPDGEPTSQFQIRAPPNALPEENEHRHLLRRQAATLLKQLNKEQP